MRGGEKAHNGEFLPVTDLEFAAALTPLLPQPWPNRLAIACSGGVDSLALALLASNFARPRRIDLVALIVDHQLRPSSPQECQLTASRLQTLGISARILPWLGPKPRSNLQAHARAARYRLLFAATQEMQADALLLAHQREDQAETFLLRLQRGSGVDGLAAMAPLSHREGLTVLRPLLGFSRRRLAACCRMAGLEWIEDPSNEDQKFLRTRMRGLLPELAAVGLSADQFAATAQRLQRARQALEGLTHQALTQTAQFHESGYAELDVPAFRTWPEEIRLRLLTQLFKRIGGHSYPPRLQSLERIEHWLREGGTGSHTLQGCRIVTIAAERALICREMGKKLPKTAISPGETVIWDRRFQIHLRQDSEPDRRSPSSQPWLIAPLGEKGWSGLPAEFRDLFRKKIPLPVRSTLPALHDLEGPVSIPHLEYDRDGRHIRLTATFLGEVS